MEGLWGLQGVMGEIVGNGNCVIGDLLENYWVLDSFGADLCERGVNTNRRKV